MAEQICLKQGKIMENYFHFVRRSVGRFLLFTKETGRDPALGEDPARALLEHLATRSGCVTCGSKGTQCLGAEGLGRYPSEASSFWERWG